MSESVKTNESKSPGEELIEWANAQHRIQILELEKKRDAAVIRNQKIHGRVLGVSLTVVSIINMVLFYAMWHHAKLCPVLKP
jgi:hypothetical protein